MNFKLGFVLLAVLFPAAIWCALPIVIYHGLSDSAHGLFQSTIDHIEQTIPGVYVTSIQMGSNAIEDFAASFFMNLNKQVSKTCQILANDTKLANGYNAIGISQGGIVMRAIVQRCPHPPVHNLITLGSPHQGVNGLPLCVGFLLNPFCNVIRHLINLGAYIDFIQDSVAPAEYWHDPNNEKLYREKSILIADINNERPPGNQTYKENLLKLNNFVMIKFLNDTVVQPKESEWFEFYAPGYTKEIVPLRNSTIYTEDRIGLKQMDEAGKLKFIQVEGQHVQFNLSWFQSEILEPYLL